MLRLEIARVDLGVADKSSILDENLGRTGDTNSFDLGNLAAARVMGGMFAGMFSGWSWYVYVTLCERVIDMLIKCKCCVRVERRRAENTRNT